MPDLQDKADPVIHRITIQEYKRQFIGALPVLPPVGIIVPVKAEAGMFHQWPGQFVDIRLYIFQPKL
jgi:hypothetical protein